MINVISMSGGKDSTAMALLAIERETENMRFVFADTGHEHKITYEYIDYLDGELKRLCGVGIDRVKADFSRQIERKRETVKTKWRDDGISEDKIERALAVLKPTGNPFLDLCLWKGRFPSTRRRFCSEELKHKPMNQYQEALWQSGEDCIVGWQGVRRDESRARADLPEKDVELGTWEPEAKGLLIYRPILDWKAEDCFAQHKKFNVKHNPLYEMGMGRVGCMPCIHATKREMREIQRRFPEEIERVYEWEKLICEASKTDSGTFLDARTVQRHKGLPEITPETSHTIKPETHGIYEYASWASTARGGRQFDLIHAIELEDVPQCSSQYGLCE